MIYQVHWQDDDIYREFFSSKREARKKVGKIKQEYLDAIYGKDELELAHLGLYEPTVYPIKEHHTPVTKGEVIVLLNHIT